jgi:hypothetical protein
VIADSIWTITNRSGEALEDALLVFTLGDTSGRRKPKPVALDGNLVEILEYSAGGVDYLFGAVRLGDLAAEGPASSVSITVRYIVGGPLQRSGRRLLLPPLGVAGVTGWTLVPEPSTGAALAFGLLALAAAPRRRRVAERAAVRGLLAVALAILVPAAQVRAQADEPDAGAARRLALEGRCEAALPELERARAASPRDPDLALLAGECAIRLGRYGDAASALEAARALAPARGDIAFQLAVARYHQAISPPPTPRSAKRGGRCCGRRAELTAASCCSSGLRRPSSRGRAERPSAGASVEPVASTTPAPLAAAEEREAREAFERVVAGWLGSEWAREAELPGAPGLARCRPGLPRAGYEHDDNVVLLGSGAQLPEIRSQRDERAAWLLEAGASAAQRPFSAGAALPTKAGPTETSPSSISTILLVAWLDRRLGEDTTPLAADGDYAWAEPFYTSHGVPRSSSASRAGTGEPGALLAPELSVPERRRPTAPAGPARRASTRRSRLRTRGLDERAQPRRRGFSVACSTRCRSSSAQLRFGYRTPLAPKCEYPRRPRARRGGGALPAKRRAGLSASWATSLSPPPRPPDPDGLAAQQARLACGATSSPDGVGSRAPHPPPDTFRLLALPTKPSNVEVFAYAGTCSVST